MSYMAYADTVAAEGTTGPRGSQPVIMYDGVTPDYFRTLRLELRRGRAFRESDGEDAPRVAIVNETMARRLWPGTDAMGKRFRMAGTGDGWWEVVGVARDSRYLTVFEGPQPFFYVPAPQQYRSRRVLEVRSTERPEALIERVRGEIRSLDPDMPVTEAQPMAEALDGFQGFWGYRMGAYLSGAMGLVGLALAVVGVFGVVAYTAAQRTREIGIRMALGAERRDVLRLVLGRGMGLVGCGVAAGMGGAWGLERLMNRLLYGTIQGNAAVFLATAGFLTGLGLWACYVPARRAMQLDPTVALRHE